MYTIEQIISYARERDYMSGVERDKNRTKATGEVFTPTLLVQEILDQLMIDLFIDPTKTFLDPTCGDGQFLTEVLIRKMENGSTYEQALSTIYGVDLMKDNCLECIKRLYMVDNNQIITVTKSDMPKGYKSAPGIKYIFKIKGMKSKEYCNIVCADGLKYDYSFGELTQFEQLFDED